MVHMPLGCENARARMDSRGPRHSSGDEDAGRRDGRRFLASLDRMTEVAARLGEALGLPFALVTGNSPTVPVTDAHAGSRGRGLAFLARVNEGRRSVCAPAPHAPPDPGSGSWPSGRTQPGFRGRVVRGRHDAGVVTGSPHHRGIVSLAHGLDIEGSAYRQGRGDLFPIARNRTGEASFAQAGRNEPHRGQREGASTASDVVSPRFIGMSSLNLTSP